MDVKNVDIFPCFYFVYSIVLFFLFSSNLGNVLLYTCNETNQKATRIFLIKSLLAISFNPIKTLEFNESAHFLRFQCFLSPLFSILCCICTLFGGYYVRDLSRSVLFYQSKLESDLKV